MLRDPPARLEQIQLPPHPQVIDWSWVMALSTSARRPTDRTACSQTMQEHAPSRVTSVLRDDDGLTWWIGLP